MKNETLQVSAGHTGQEDGRKKILPRESALVHRNEALEVAARRKHYEEILKARHQRLLTSVQRVTSYGVPSVYLTFAVVYFAVGLSYYNSDDKIV